MALAFGEVKLLSSNTPKQSKEPTALNGIAPSSGTRFMSVVVLWLVGSHGLDRLDRRNRFYGLDWRNGFYRLNRFDRFDWSYGLGCNGFDRRNRFNWGDGFRLSHV